MLWVLGDLPLCELLDLLSDDLDASLIRSVELQNPLLVKVLPEKLFRHRKHR